MNLAFSMIPLLVSVLVVPSIFGAYIKLSAVIFRYKNITWINGFVFGIILIITGILIRAATYFAGLNIPVLPGVILGLVVTLIIGGWFFNKKGLSVNGESIGWSGALKLVGLSFLFLVVSAMVLSGVSSVLLQRTIP